MSSGNDEINSDSEGGSNDGNDSKTTTDDLVVHQKEEKYSIRKPGLKQKVMVSPYSIRKPGLKQKVMVSPVVALQTGRGLRKNRHTHSQNREVREQEQVVIGEAEDVIGEEEDDIQPTTMAVATALTQEDMQAEIRQQIMEEAVVGTAIPMPASPPPPPNSVKRSAIETRRLCGFPISKVVYAVTVVAFVVLIGAVVGLSLSTSNGSGNDGTTADPSAEPTANPTVSYSQSFLAPSAEPTANPTVSYSQAPSAEPTDNPVTVSYSQSILAPNKTSGGSYFDHLELFGFTPADKSRIHKISQIKVYATVACVTNNNCSLPTATILSLVVTYVLKDCSTSTQTSGAYTGEGFTPDGIVNLKSDQYITRIEVLVESNRLTHIKICTLGGECFGPFGASLNVAPTTVFEHNSSVVHSFYGYSGSWLDAMGVYYEDVGDGGVSGTTTCG